LRQAIAAMRDDLQARVDVGRAEANAQLMRLQFSTLLSVALVTALAIFVFLDGRRRFEHLRWVQNELAFSNANLDRGIKSKTSALSVALAAARQAEDNVRELNAHLEEQVTERSRELDRIFRLSSDILGVGDFDGRLVRISPAYEAVIGRKASDALAHPLVEMIHPEDRAATEPAFAKVFAGRTPVDFVARSLRADGRLCWLSWRIVSVFRERLFYFVVRDITEYRHREEVVRQAQKMEAVGQLTGGIAHDFNNLLTIVIGNLDSLKRGLIEAPPRALRQIDHALIGAQKAASLTGRLLAFSRRQPLAPTVIDVNGLVVGMTEILHRSLGETIAVETALAGGLWRTQADPNQLENAILNLAINARDAMPSGGKLIIETANSHLDDSYVSANPGAMPGEYVQVAVTDTGEGMSPDVVSRAFEPFFTTKPAGVGTGLGLSQVYGFLKQSGGHISISSEAGVGTTIKLFLPRSFAAPESEAAAWRPAPVEAKARGESVLVVEDENGVRDFVIEALEDAGYRVYAAAEGAAALTELKAHPDIDLMVSDVVLGGLLDGRQLRDEAMKLRPDLPVLYITGYTRNAILHDGRLDEGVQLLTKPFTASDLLGKLRKMLDARDVAQLKLL
jgi:PAS domain S-box-containing protein